MPLVVLETAEANQTERNRITAGFPFKAYYDTTTGYGIQVALTNTRAVGYYA